jgi:hypothetical protein
VVVRERRPLIQGTMGRGPHLRPPRVLQAGDAFSGQPPRLASRELGARARGPRSPPTVSVTVRSMTRMCMVKNGDSRFRATRHICSPTFHLVSGPRADHPDPPIGHQEAPCDPPGPVTPPRERIARVAPRCLNEDGLQSGAPMRSRVERRLPALSSLWGYMPAQEMRRPGTGTCRVRSHVGERTRPVAM